MNKRPNAIAGGKQAGQNARYWHGPACRLYLHLKRTQPGLKSDARYERIAEMLNSMGGTIRTADGFIGATVKDAIKKCRRNGTLQAIEYGFSDHPEDLPDIDLAAEKENAADRDDDGTIAAAATLLDAPYCPLPRSFEIIAGKAITKLRNTLREAELKWVSEAELAAHNGGSAGDFPAKNIVLSAFADYL